MARLPKFPRGLKRTLAKLERKEAFQKKVAERKKEIESARKKVDSLRKKFR